MAPEDRNQVPPPPPRQPAPTQHQQPLGDINVIFGGFAGGGESSLARKAHLHRIKSRETLEVQVVSKLPRLDITITFSDSDMEGYQHPHDDPLVIRDIMANKTVHRVLIDNWSSIDIIFASMFDKMGIGREKLESVNAHLVGFSGEKVLPLGSVQLVLTLGDPPCQATMMIKFLIVDALSAYTGHAFSQCHKGHPFCLSYGCQIPYGEWSRNGSRTPEGSQRVLLYVNETKSN